MAQITQYARQLASSPSIIDNRSRQHLNDVGLTVCDCVIINKSVVLLAFRRGPFTTFQAYLGHPVRWLPGLEIQNYADASLFADESLRWRSSYEVEKTPEEHKVQLQNFANWPTHSLSTLFHFPFSKSC
ncbi:hypothetical protein DMH88_17755 [Escherichia coli]|nr:hypothetical protein [Escherichia coli]